MLFSLPFWFCVSSLYIFIGVIFHVWLSEDNRTYHHSSFGNKVWVTFCNVTVWWFLLGILLTWLFVHWYKDPTAPKLKYYLLLFMPYERWISMLRWGAVLTFLYLLGIYGPRYRNWPAPPDEKISTSKAGRDSLSTFQHKYHAL